MPTRRERIPDQYRRYRELMNGDTENIEAPVVTGGGFYSVPTTLRYDPSMWRISTGTPGTLTWGELVEVDNECTGDMDTCPCSMCVEDRQHEEEQRAREEASPNHTCNQCGFNREQHGYRDWIEWIEGPDSNWYCTDCCIQCRTGCEQRATPPDYFNNRFGYCDNCTVMCFDCSDEIVDPTDDNEAFVWDGTNRRRRRGAQIYCMECVFTCANCNEMRPRNTQAYVDGIGECCNTCAQFCGNCGRNTIGRCSCAADAIRGYGETVPRVWLGGPLKHDDNGNDIGYYVGFELEISARDTDRRRLTARPVREWAQEHLEDNEIFDCKHDGSVRGFEIATQPMTPAYFEAVDWESFMDMLNDAYPLRTFNLNDEPREHGLHVHIGRVAFRKDPVAQAAYAYLIGQGDHLERIGRRAPYHYCAKVLKPVSASIAQTKPGTKQGYRIRAAGIGYGRDAINLTNGRTIEIRAFKSTRSANELRDAVRLTYLCAEYVRHLRGSGEWSATAKALHWTEFAAWVGIHYPEAFASISGIRHDGSNKMENVPEFWA